METVGDVPPVLVNATCQFPERTPDPGLSVPLREPLPPPHAVQAATLLSARATVIFNSRFVIRESRSDLPVQRDNALDRFSLAGLRRLGSPH